jgi:hypothetical protein
MRILVITSCTGRKKHKPPNQLQYEDFTSSERLRKRTAELKYFKASAAEMYTGQQHLYLMDGLRQLRKTHGQTVVDLNIISAGYGLLGEKDVIVPYNVTFQKLKKKEILERSDKLQIYKHVETSIADYKLVFFLLGKEYVQALKLPFKIPDTVTQIFLAAPSWKYVFSDFLSDIHVVCAGRDLVDQLDGATGYNLKGFVFKRLCNAACRDGFQVFEDVKQNPQLILDIIQ